MYPENPVRRGIVVLGKVSFCVWLCALVAACASGSARVNSRVQVQDAVPITRLFVYANVKDRYFTGTVYEGMREGLMNGFSACGVTVAILHVDPLELDMNKKRDEAIAAFKADATMTILRTGGNVVIEEGGNNGVYAIDMKIHERKTGREIWRAKSEVRLLTSNLFVNDRKSGERLGVGMVATLKKDGLLTHCSDSAQPK